MALRISDEEKTTMELNTSNWKLFKVTDLFDISGTAKKEPEDFAGEGRYPLISARTTDNGALGFYDSYVEKGGALVIETSCNGHCTYQRENFSGHGHLAVLRPKFQMNDPIALFLVTIFNYEKYLYNYGRKCNIGRLKKKKIRLPAIETKKGYQPDWSFMEKYMMSLLQTPFNEISSFFVSFRWRVESQ